MGKKKDLTFVLAAALGGALAAWSVSAYLREKRALLKQLQAGSTMIATPYGPIETAIVGQGPAVLMLHGSAGGYDMGVLFSNAQRGFQYISVSRPGYLRTPLAVGETPEQQADAYASLLDELGIEKAAVLGMSGGGPAAIHFAARHPDRCWGLVLISAISKVLSLPPLVASVAEKTPAQVDFLLWGITKLPYVPIVGGPSWAAQRSMSPERRTAFKALLMTIFPISVRMSGIVQDLKLIQTERVYPLEAVQSPTFVIHGEADAIVRIENGFHSAQQIPHAEQMMIPGGSHLVYVTHADLIEPRLTAFLKRHAPEN